MVRVSVGSGVREVWCNSWDVSLAGWEVCFVVWRDSVCRLSPEPLTEPHPHYKAVVTNSVLELRK